LFVVTGSPPIPTWCTSPKYSRSYSGIASILDCNHISTIYDNP
jgi:hypothetical protein